MTTDPTPWISALRRSHDRLTHLVRPLDAEQVAEPSYAAEWSIAQVLSHLGSGAEIFGLVLDSVVDGTEPPGGNRFGPIWDVWNAKKPHEQATDALVVDAAFVERVEGLDQATRDGMHIALFGRDLDLAGLLGMRLGEHALHTWDVAVALDDAATVAPDAVDLLIDLLGGTAARAARSDGRGTTVAITTTAPTRHFVLDTGTDAVTFGPGEQAGGAQLVLPGEALVRLVYGRLDAAHTPQVEATGVDLEELRAVFPGF